MKDNDLYRSEEVQESEASDIRDERNLQSERSVFVITGLSGAGKSYASHALEDGGFYCVDNLPPDLIKQFVELATRSKGRAVRLGLVCDVRGGSRFNDLFQALSGLKKLGVVHRIIFLEASDEVLLRRFSETRRRHPLDSGSLRDDISKERKLLEDVRCRADVIIDTSDYSVSRLKEHMMELIDLKQSKESLNVQVTSFGFKYGLPIESELVFDLRFLPNPHYVNDLAGLTGQNEKVQKYILESRVSGEFKSQVFDLIDFLMPEYIREGKCHLNIAFGCTGGRHRSVTFAELLKKHLRSQGFRVLVEHRDLER